MWIRIAAALLAGVITALTSQNYEWIFGGVGVILAGAILFSHLWIGSPSRYPAFIGFLGMGLGLWFSAVFFDSLKQFGQGSVLFLLSSPFLFYTLFALAGFYLGFQGASKVSWNVSTGPEKKDANTPLAQIKILDTSSIIDSRVIDVCETGFIEGLMVIPKFVLIELQQVADSTDPAKRSRGRKGLTELSRLKQSKKVTVKILEQDYPDLREVDHKLIKLAKDRNGCLVTTDYNLNKIASLEGVKVLNVNELANALKPVVMTNEELLIAVIKEGKDPNQGIGYLDDGTMVVVDGGRDYLGKEIYVVVTSVLQTAAGRMIFTQPKHPRH